MNNAILIQQIYPNTEGVKLLELTQQRHQAYCDLFNMDYQHVIDNPLPEYDAKLGSWAKIKLIKDALQKGYEYVIWLDADTLIASMETDLRDAIHCYDIGACWHRIPQLNHWNVGALYIYNCPASVDFVNQWLASYPPEQGWLEQGVFNKLAMQSKTVQTISDRWNATLNYTMVPDAVVLGFHGYGTTQERYEAMQATLKSLETREGVR